MMTSTHIIFLCLLATALLCFPKCFGSSYMQGRRLVREPSVSSRSSLMSLSSQYDELHKIQARKMRMEQGGPTAAEVSRSEEGLEEELVYHIDYHGVITHPTPTPKHPTP